MLMLVVGALLGAAPPAAAQFGLPQESVSQGTEDARRFMADCPEPVKGVEATTPGGTTNCLGGEGHRPIGAGSWVRMRVAPAFARLYVNGTFVGTAQQFARPYRGLRIGLGPHFIQLRAPGYRSESFWMMQRADRTSELARSLQPN
jgi:hypothetical protein